GSIRDGTRRSRDARGGRQDCYRARWRRALFDPPRRQHLAVRRGERLAPAAEKIDAAGERLLEEALLLERLAEDDAQHPALARVGHRLDPRLPPIDERLRVAGVRLDDGARRLGALAGDLALRLDGVGDLAAEIRDRRRQPRKLYVLAVDDVLVRVVGVVLAHE